MLYEFALPGLAEQVRHEPAKIVGDQSIGLANTHPGRILVDHPTAQHGTLAVEIRDWRNRLVDEPLSAIRAVGLRFFVSPHHLNVRALA